MGASPTTPTPVSSRHTTRAALAVAAAVLMWGFSSVAIKTVDATGIVTSFYRLWLAIPLLWLAPALDGGLRSRLDGRWLRACLAGGSLFALHQLLFFSSVKLTTIANVTLVGALQPALILLVAGSLFSERASLRSALWCAVAFGATCFFVLQGRGAPGSSLLGDGLAAANLLAFTAYILVSKHYRSDLAAWDYVVGMTTVSGLWVAGVALATAQDLAAPRSWEWLLLFGLAVFPGTLGHFLVNWAHAHTSAFAVSMMLLAVPVIAVLGAAVWLGEALGPGQLLGGAVVLLAIARIVAASRDEAPELAQGAAETDAP